MLSNSLTYPRTTRLLTPLDYKRVFKQAEKLKYNEFTVYICRNGLEHARLGLAVSKKAAKKAVTRNKIKRIIRESFRLNQHQLRGWDVVFVANHAAAHRSSEQLHQLLVKIWKRLDS